MFTLNAIFNPVLKPAKESGHVIVNVKIKNKFTILTLKSRESENFFVNKNINGSNDAIKSEIAEELSETKIA